MVVPKILTKEDVFENEEFIISEMRVGKIFIYPTDTLYGFGINSKAEESIEKIYDIKKRTDAKILNVAPSLEWVYENCEVNDEIKKDLNEMLPGPYSFILKVKNKDFVYSKLISDVDCVGIRMPDCWFYEVIKKAGIAFTSTSVNFTGEPPVQHIEDLPKEIYEQVDYVVLGKGSGKPSTIVNYSTGKREVIERK